MYESAPDDPSLPWPLRIANRLDGLVGGLVDTGAPKHGMVSWLRSIAADVRRCHEQDQTPQGAGAWQPFSTAPTDGTVVLVAWIREERCKHGVSYSWIGEPALAKFWVDQDPPHWRTLDWSDPLEVEQHGRKALELYRGWLRERLQRRDPVVLAALRAIPADAHLVCHCVRPDGSGACHGRTVALAWEWLHRKDAEHAARRDLEQRLDRVEADALAGGERPTAAVGEIAC